MKLHHAVLLGTGIALGLNVVLLLYKPGTTSQHATPLTAVPITAPVRVPVPERPTALTSPSRKSAVATAPAAPVSASLPKPVSHVRTTRQGLWLLPSSRPSLDQVVKRADDLLDAVWPEAEHPTTDAGQFLVSRDFPRALAAYDRLLVHSPNDPALLLGKGMALVGLGRHEDALPLFENALEHDSGNTSARFNYAVTLARLGQGEAAEKAFRALLERQPQHARARFNLATLLTSRQQYDIALPIWRILTDTSPPVAAQPNQDAAKLTHDYLVQAWSHRGECALAVAKLQESEQSFQKVLDLLPDARAWANLGIAKAALSKSKEAKAALAKAIELDPKLIPALNQLAYLNAVYYRDTGDPEARAKVLEMCQRSLVLAPGQGNIRQLRFVLEHEGEEAPTTDAEEANKKDEESLHSPEFYRDLRR